MAFSDIEIKRLDNIVGTYVESRRPPPHIRPKLDLAFRIIGQSVEIFEIRPDWLNPRETMENNVAKATYVKTQKTWKVFWQRADLKWHRYDPEPEAETIQEFLDIVHRDELCCFFG